MKKKYFVSLAGLLAMVAAGLSPAMAADSGWYVGFDVGQSRIKVDTAGIDAAVLATGLVATSATSADEDDVGWMLYGGYQFNQNFALEGGYTDLGKASTTTVTTGPAATVLGEARTKAWGLDVVGILPLNKQFDLYAKLGIYRWDVDATAVASVGGAVGAASVSANGTDVKTGLGGRFNFTDSVSLRLGWERFNNVGNDATGKTHVDLFAAGLQIKF